MNNNYIIKNAYSYIDKKMENLKPKYTQISSYDTVLVGNDATKSIIEFKNKEGEIIFKSEYEILSILYKPLEKDKNVLCVWSWAHPLIDKNLTFLSRKLLTYGLDITNIDDYTSRFIKSLLTNSRLKVSQTEVDLLNAISLYITKKEGIVRIPKELNNIHFEYNVILTKIFD